MYRPIYDCSYLVVHRIVAIQQTNCAIYRCVHARKPYNMLSGTKYNLTGIHDMHIHTHSHTLYIYIYHMIQQSPTD